MKTLQVKLSIEPTEQTGAYLVEGNCLEGANVLDGSHIIIANDLMPRPGEITTCYIKGVFSAKILCYRCADGYVVKTNYTEQKDKYCLVPEVKGAAIACVHNGVTLWENKLDYEQRRAQDERRKKMPPSNCGMVIPFESISMKGALTYGRA